MYSATEIAQIYVAAQTLITGQTAYHNALKSYVNAMTDVEEIATVQYGIESEWLFPDRDDPTKTVPISTLNSWAETFSNILGIPVYWHSLRHFFTTSLAKANLPDSVIKTIIGWESLEMVDIYKDIDDEDEIGKYCMNGEIVGQKQAALSDL